MFLRGGEFELHQGDALDTLRTLPGESVHMCVTSPPFFGLRDYGVDGQIGLEATPELWVERLVAVFREVRRVLRKDGTLWLEVGDAYNGSGGYAGPDAPINQRRAAGEDWGKMNPASVSALSAKKGNRVGGLKAKDLIGAPWMLAFALRADGWWLRSDIIWARPNPMPESVTDRPTKAHSYLFLMSKSARYYMDMDAIREPVSPASDFGRDRPSEPMASSIGSHRARLGNGSVGDPSAGRNARSVWNIPTQPLPYDHYAAFPEELARRCILAGTSERGVCPDCGAPWRRVTGEVETKPDLSQRSTRHYNTADRYGADNGGNDGLDDLAARMRAGIGKTTTGWEPTCECTDRNPESYVIPATVLDPFIGSGTVALVARKHGRKCIGIELSERYCEIALERNQQDTIFSLTGGGA